MRFDFYFYDCDLQDLKETPELAAGESLEERVDFVLVETLYKVQYHAPHDKMISSHDRFKSADIQAMVRLLYTFMSSLVHGHLFCCVLQSSVWYDALNAELEDGTEE